jgi:lysophospholipase L1-like esterase
MAVAQKIEGNGLRFDFDDNRSGGSPVTNSGLGEDRADRFSMLRVRLTMSAESFRPVTPTGVAMKPLVRSLAALFCLLALAVSLRADDPKPMLAKLELVDGDGIVFLGDSITHQLLYTQYVEDFFYQRMPGTKLRFHNAGVGGAQAWDALRRFDRDVAAYKPKYVTILLGMNDGHYRPFHQETFDTYQKDMTEVLKRIVDIGATPIPMTPTMFDARARRIATKQVGDANIALYNSVLTYYGTWLRDQADQNGWGFVDMWSPLNNLTLEQRKKDANFTMIGDAVHPGPDGQLVMASAIINDLSLSRQLSKILISHGKDGKLATADSDGGKISDLSIEADKIDFTWLADGLPWVVPADAAKGAELLHAGHRWSREVLEVHGLAPGQYSLTIDGKDVGTYSSDSLEKGVELQGNEKTPQYQQALEVATINKKRCEGPMAKIRNGWGQFQGYARLRRHLGENPEDEKAKQQFEGLEKAVADLDERVAKFNEEAAKLVEEIYSKNKPTAHKYSLKRSTANVAARP